MAPETRQAASNPVPPPPPDPGDLGGCSSLEADLAAKRAALLEVYNALQTAAQAVKDFRYSCEEILKSPIPLPGSTACQEYMDAKANYDSKLSEFNALYQEFIAAANAFNSKFPVCDAVTCPNGQAPQGELSGLQIPNIGIPDPTSAINEITNCKSAIDAAITDINNRIKSKEDCVSFLGSVIGVCSVAIPSGKGPVLKTEEGKPPQATFEPIDPNNPNFSLQNMINTFVGACIAGFQACSGSDLGYGLGQGASYVPANPPTFSNNASRYNREIWDWVRKTVAPNNIQNFLDALKTDLEKLNLFKSGLEKSMAEADDALSTLSPENYESEANDRITQIKDLIDSLFTIEVTSANIGFIVNNQPSNGNASSLAINDSSKLDGLVSIDRSTNPPIGTVIIGKAMSLLEESLGPPVNCPPKRGDKGKWGLPISVTATVKQYIKPEKKEAFIQAVDLINKNLIGKKMDCSGLSEGKRPTSVGAISLNFDPNGLFNEVSSSLSACKGASQ